MQRVFILLTCCLTVVSVAACGRERPTRTFSQPAPEAKASAGPNAKGAVAAGTVTETMDAGGYTYVQVDTGSQKVWAAAPKFQVKVGDRVVVPEGAPMRNYHSKTLNRDFDVVYFASSIQNSTGGEMPKGSGVPSGRAPTTGSSSVAQVDVSGVEKAEGGLTVGELFAGKAELSGKEVTLRAKVVKFTPQVMGKNWLHVQDGSGDAAARTHDLTVTTDVTAKVGDTVLITGPVTLDKDFGAGYKYDVIIEDAKVTVE